MRQRKLKYVNEELINELGIISALEKIKVQKHTYLEVGSGKGKFITDLAKTYKENFYIALEKSMDICYRIYEKKIALNLTNLLILNIDVKDLHLIFDNNSLAGIYLNFSDPWPKKKHFKRRLTNEDFLKTYYNILKSNGFIQFRTDHKAFFEDSISLLEKVFLTKNITNNLEVSEFMTEYEIKKRELGPIYEYRGEKDVK